MYRTTTCDDLADFWAALDAYGRRREPLLFLIDFEMQRPMLFPLHSIRPDRLLYNFHGITNAGTPPQRTTVPQLTAHPQDPERYREAFRTVQQGLGRGDSFLVNLTFPTPVELQGSLHDVFHATEARYRIWLKDRFVCFSPEIFVQIRDDRIYSFPMKGTAPDRPGAGEELMADPKEIAEHATIADLIRNDLSTVARRVRVERYRYLEKVVRQGSGLWQTSSRIAGDLSAGWQDHLGTLLRYLLPAGSVSGAPKPSTLEIIRRAEQQDRGFYCGVAGLFDGQRLDSCVMIRFIEQRETGHYFWSGGGITARSNWQAELQELTAKVYLPAGAGQSRPIPLT